MVAVNTVGMSPDASFQGKFVSTDPPRLEGENQFQYEHRMKREKWEYNEALRKWKKSNPLYPKMKIMKKLKKNGRRR